MRTRRLWLSIVFVALLVAGSVAGFLTGTRPQLGLDLVGGISVVLAGPEGTPREVMERTLESIRTRVDALGVAEADVSIVGDNDIQVQVPGLTTGVITERDGKFCAEASTGEDLGCEFETESAAEAAAESLAQQRLLDLIGQTARLEERQVVQPTPGAKVTACPPELSTDEKCFDEEFVECPLDRIESLPACSPQRLENRNVVFLGTAGRTFDQRERFPLGPVEIDGSAIASATAVYITAAQGGPSTDIGWQVDFRLTKEGARIFGEVTTRLVGQQLAIILDREVVSDPVIREPITGGSGNISGNFSEPEAKDLALVLNAGALPVELERRAVETVSPTLGEQSLKQGLLAGIGGVILLSLYLAFYYRLLGVITWVGMAISSTFVFALVAIMGQTVGYSLSLAGIAGFIVALGITADSYIVFYERLKDEVRAGKTLRVAVVPAFKQSWRTIRTANSVTILGAVVLYMLAIGSVRGFALTLGLSTAIDMFVVFFFKRPLVFLMARNPKLVRLRGFGMASGVGAEPVPVAGGSK